ncbi:MAG: signal transduction histidine kinase [Planctomycetota bacterium]|jgi:signal transduction histidine kinase
MRISLLNGSDNPAPYQAILEASGHQVTAYASVAGDFPNLTGNPDVLIWNFSADKDKLAREFSDFALVCKDHSSPTIAIVPLVLDTLEQATQTSGVEHVLRQPTSTQDLASALARTNFEYDSASLSEKSLPLILVVGNDQDLLSRLNSTPLDGVATCVHCHDVEQAVFRCKQLSFDCVIFCDPAATIPFHEYRLALQPVLGNVGLIGFLDPIVDGHNRSLPSGLSWIDTRGDGAHLLQVVSNVLEDRSRSVRRKELDFEIVGKQQELQRVNAMLRTINKAFHDTNIRLEREGHTKDQMIGVAAHELKSPLAAMSGALDFLCDDLSRYDGDDRKLLELLKRNNQRMIKLVENVLDLSRVEARRITLHPTSCPPTSVVEHAIEEVAMRAQQKGIQFELLDNPDLTEWWVDVGTVEQMLVNLLDNAVKFSPRDGIIKVMIRAVGSEIHFVVADQGPGIPPPERALVFERFHHRSRGDDPHSGGSGLGLTITKALAEFLSGRVTLGESPTGGALFTISLPFISSPVEADD